MIGLTFRPLAGGEGGRMCSWCHSFGGPNQIGLLSTPTSNKRTVGVMACLDLNCIENVETAGKLSKKPYNLLVEDLIVRMVHFYENGVKGAGSRP